jgi:hypothetical protein
VSPALVSAPGLSAGSCSTATPRNDHRHHRSTVTRPPRVLPRRGQPSANASREVSLCRPSAFTGRAVPSAGDANSTDHPAPTFPGMGTHASAGPSLRFFSPRVSFPFFACVETPPARVIRGRCLSPAYRARDPGCYHDLAGRLHARRRSWDSSFPSQCSSDSRAITPHRHDRAHLPFPRLHPPRVSSSRGLAPVKARVMGGAAAAPGLCVRSLKPAVPCHPPTPPWLLCTGSFVLTGQDCPGISMSSLRSSASRLRPPLLKAIPPGLLVPPPATSLQR